MALIGATQEEIQVMPAEDITYLSADDALAMKANKKLRTIAVSGSIDGMNGAIYRGKNGALYKITTRCDALFAITP